MPCKERLLKEKRKKINSLSCSATTRIAALAVAAVVPHPILNYSITIGNGKQWRVAVWRWHVASWPTTNTTNAQAKSMATRTSCATSVATFGRGKATRHRGSSRKTFYPSDPFYCCHRSWCCLTTRRKTAMTSTATATATERSRRSSSCLLLQPGERPTKRDVAAMENRQLVFSYKLQEGTLLSSSIRVCVCAHTYVYSASLCALDLSTYLATTSPSLCLCTLSLPCSFSLSRIAGSVERCQGQHSHWWPFNAMQQSSCKIYIAKREIVQLMDVL